MNIISEKELRQKILKKVENNVFFLFGDDHYLLRNYVSKIVKKSLGTINDFNYSKFDNFSTIQDVYNALITIPFMCTVHAVTFLDPKLSELSEKDIDVLISIAEKPVPNTVFIIWFETEEINPRELSTKCKKIMTAIDKNNGVIAQINHKSDSEIIDILCKGASKRSCNMQPTTARYMLRFCSSDLNVLLNELDKVCAYAEDGIITNDMVDEVCTKSLEASIYDLTKKLLSGNIKSAYEIIDNLLFMKTEPIIILSEISKTYIDMFRAKSIIAAGKIPINCAEEFGYSKKMAFRMDIADKNARYLTVKQLRDSLELIKEADMSLKSGGDDNLKKDMFHSLLASLYSVLKSGESY